MESIFYLWRVTKEPIYREWGWKIFQAFNKHSRVASGGFTGLSNVQDPRSHRTNRMESFWLGETLKYAYLLFSDDDMLPLDRYVFNTEAHPLPMFLPPWGHGSKPPPPPLE
jgi:endoplasmic reticulum Man9GlcNAc2 1,2-alpha-mannosidase